MTATFTRCPASLVSGVRLAVARRADWAATADLVAAGLRRNLPDPDILSAAERAGDPDGYQCHVLHVEADGSFSIQAMVWRPGQVTPIHDHVSWCVTGVLAGSEHEELFGISDDGGALIPGSERDNPPGTVGGFAPPGDIHRVRNAGDGVAVSMHVYGADITRLGSSIRRVYDLPVLAHAGR